MADTTTGTRTFTGAGFPASSEVAWMTVLAFVVRLGVDPNTVLTAGTPAWDELPDDHPDKLGAVLAAGVHHALRIDCEQTARTYAAKAIAAATDWHTQPRSNAYIPRSRTA